eukprot:TRINITY_DN93836_c0_g1_i1.p1 TRINITY_DN93836_c0_g1~~TRINITY_DN93836_c0_g1_i1.p1  ORF type:complete len:307 (-),score=57.12 TRINITY_DN93836_c0_g1_i1:27-881(-)
MAVTVNFLSGQSFEIEVAETDTVLELLMKVKRAMPPPTAASHLKLVSASGVLRARESAAGLVGAVVDAAYATGERSYYVLEDGQLSLVDEGDDGWDEETSKRFCRAGGFCSEEHWVPPPDGRVELRNLVRESEGVSLTASSNIFNDEQKLLNIIRLGSAHGEPRCVVKGDSSFIFAERDRNPTLTLDFGRVVLLQRVGAIGAKDRWINSFEVTSTPDADPRDGSWTSWGVDRHRHTGGGPIFLDMSAPIPARFVRFKVTSGHVNGARVGNLFAYGCEASSEEKC